MTCSTEENISIASKSIDMAGIKDKASASKKKSKAGSKRTTSKETRAAAAKVTPAKGRKKKLKSTTGSNQRRPAQSRVSVANAPGNGEDESVATMPTRNDETQSEKNQLSSFARENATLRIENATLKKRVNESVVGERYLPVTGAMVQKSVKEQIWPKCKFVMSDEMLSDCKSKTSIGYRVTKHLQIEEARRESFWRTYKFAAQVELSNRRNNTMQAIKVAYKGKISFESLHLNLIRIG